MRLVLDPGRHAAHAVRDDKDLEEQEERDSDRCDTEPCDTPRRRLDVVPHCGNEKDSGRQSRASTTSEEQRQLTPAEPVEAERGRDQLLRDVDPARESKNLVSPCEVLLLLSGLVVLQLIVSLHLDEAESDVNRDDEGCLKQHPRREAEEQGVLRGEHVGQHGSPGIGNRLRHEGTGVTGKDTHVSVEEGALPDEQQEETEEMVEVDAGEGAGEEHL